MQKILISLMVILSLMGCAKMPLLYQPTIQQGNILTPDMLAELKSGMSAEQVRYILGTPVLTSTFEPNRWDYVYTYQAGHGQMIRKLVTVHFENGVVKSYHIK